MLYTVNLDNDNYILSISHTEHDNVPLNLETLELKYLNAYKLIDEVIGVVILDEDKKQQLINEENNEAKQTEIHELKRMLYETDYLTSRCFEEIMALDNKLTFIVDFINICIKYATKYKEIINNRKAWRKRIEELEK